ncbi:hypothetical protein NV379_18805 [Paenibacillus sp. N1-5-1-14]|uniref:hypothetical protein n=1 Tax=Paenibacillus radicibacter TaxID=2972488 RepID=UPI0021595082|nr:hypothetical protein [Paenibacillus radicibacter]MCR8644708.1 hypothetical protein [Paenibacillus radicibacter]
MSKKLAIQFRKSTRTRYTFERLKYCKSCGNYSVLWDDHCLKCGQEGKFVPLQHIVKSIHRNQFLRDICILLSIGIGTFFLSRTLQMMIISILASLVLLALFIWLTKRYSTLMEKKTLDQLLIRENKAIREGIILDVEDAAENLKNKDYQLAYEKLREISYLINGNQVKVLKLMCLDHFILRKDMDLELQTLIPIDFNENFVRYLNGVSKVNPQLIKRDAIEYVLKYRVAIELMPEGRETVALVASAALRVKSYVIRYQELIFGHIEDFPKDRLLRLCQLLQGSSSDSPLLYNKVKDIVKNRYDSDPDFQGLL